jgi:hypothetical protein
MPGCRTSERHDFAVMYFARGDADQPANGFSQVEIVFVNQS